MIVAVNKETKKYLKDRLARLTSEKQVFWGSEDVKLPKPAAVSEAERRMKRDGAIVNRFHKKQRLANERRKLRKRKMRDECEKAIHFGTAKQALKLLDKFERTKF